MCGFIVLKRLGSGSVETGELERMRVIGQRMLETQRFRGPDEFNVVPFGTAILGHARLSIIDLSTGTQPIFNEDGTIAVLLNGEIYNYPSLRNRLQRQGHTFSTQSDTEVIVHLYEEVGEDVFSHLNGMFSAVIYDSRSDILLAGRDRVGEKPLLYWQTEDEMVIATELKAIAAHPAFRRRVDNDALSMYFQTMYVPAPLAIFEGVKKLQPASYLRVKGRRAEVRTYWSLPTVTEPLTDEGQIIEEFEPLFTDAISMRKIADVPIGVFLSGGIDSSAVAAFMSRTCDEPIRTFSARFGDAIDETPYADLVAKRYGTEHYLLNVEDDIADVLQDVLTYFDEPFGDSSALPTYLISRKAREHVKVVLTGDGGDELFAGYDAYVDQKHLVGGKVTSKMADVLNGLARRVTGLDLREQLYPKNSGRWAVTHWLWIRTIFREQELPNLLREPAVSGAAFFDSNRWLDLHRSDALSKAYSHDMNFYLPDDLLKKVDMAAMHASLECRAPFLDHRLIEFSFRISPALKLKNDVLKHLLKRALEPHLPEKILYRPKQGFGAPVEEWLQNQLYELTNDLLAPGCMCEDYVERRAIQTAIGDVFLRKCEGDYLAAPRLWLILVFEIWLRSYMRAGL